MAQGGDGQDICTFFASFVDQRQQVERLINWLRESQTTCTDTNCFDSISGFPGTEQGGAVLPGTSDNQECQDSLDQGPFAIVLMFVFALLTLYAMSVNRGRQDVAEPTKKSSSEGPQNDHDRFRRHDDDSDGGNRPSEI